MPASLGPGCGFPISFRRGVGCHPPTEGRFDSALPRLPGLEGSPAGVWSASAGGPWAQGGNEGIAVR